MFFTYFTIIFLTIQLHYTNVTLTNNLKNLCPMQSIIKAAYTLKKNQFIISNPDEVFPSQEQPEFYKLKNIETLTNILFSDTKCLGEGTYGKVYGFTYVDPENHEEKDIVSKVIRFPGDSSKEDDYVHQEILAMEISANNTVYSESLGKFFFPQLFGCFEFTQNMNSLTQSIDIEKISKNELENIKVKDSEGVATIFMEKLNISLRELINLNITKKARFLDQERLNLFYLAAKGLETMDKYFLHCDIKPENFMLKKVNIDEIKEMYSNKIEPARLSSKEFYTLKYIDFGLISFEERNERECEGGTPGFIPNEYLQEEVSNEKFDVYSLGMSFLNLELAERGYSGFSFVDAILYKRKKAGGFELTEEDITNLNKIRIVKKMKEIMVDEKYKTIFLKRLENIYSNIKIKVESGSKPENYLEIDPLAYIDRNVNSFRYMMITALSVYFNEYIVNQYKVPTVENYDKKIQEINEELVNSTNKNVILAKRNYFISKKKVFCVNKFMISNLVELYLEMISRNHEKRPSVQEVLLRIEKIKTSFYQNVGSDIEEIYLYEDEVKNDESIPETNLLAMAKTIPLSFPEPVEIKAMIQIKEFNPKIFSGQRPQKHDKNIIYVLI